MDLEKELMALTEKDLPGTQMWIIGAIRELCKENRNLRIVALNAQNVVSDYWNKEQWGSIRIGPLMRSLEEIDVD